MVYNVELYNKQLSYMLNNYYKQCAALNKKGSSEPDSRIWCTKADVTMLADSLIAAATDNADNYLLQELVEELELSSELFAA